MSEGIRRCRNVGTALGDIADLKIMGMDNDGRIHSYLWIFEDVFRTKQGSILYFGAKGKISKKYLPIGILTFPPVKKKKLKSKLEEGKKEHGNGWSVRSC